MALGKNNGGNDYMKRNNFMNNKREIFWGVMFIAIAAYILLNQLGLVDTVIGTGNIILAIVFFATLIKSITMLSFPGIFISMAFLWIIFDEYTAAPHISEIVIIFVAVLFSIGFSMIFPHKKRKINYADFNEKCEKYEEDDGNVFCSNRFGASSKYINGRRLQSARIENSFGELKIFFDNAAMDGSSVNVSVSVSFGSLEMYIPKEWEIVNRVNAFAASVNEKNQGSPDGNHTVTLIGSVNFGEISVIYV